MRHQRKSFSANTQRGNAMVYVLIIVALFAALSFVLARQTGTSESGTIADEQVEIYAGTIQQAAMQLKQSVEQMTYTGTQVSELDFTTPDEASFETAPVIHKVFHPHGGGVILPRLPDDAVNEITTPSAKWYIGSFNHVEWTPTTADDVILTAYQLNEQVCARLNEKLTGSSNIPIMTVPATDVLMYNSSGNSNFTSAQCQDGDSPADDVDCEGKPSLCVQDSAGAWSFFSIIAAE